MDKLEQMVQMYAYHYETFRTLYFSKFFDSRTMSEFKQFLEEPDIHYAVVYPVFKTYLRRESKLSRKMRLTLYISDYYENVSNFNPNWDMYDESILFEVRAKVLEEMLVEFKQIRG